MPMPSPWSGAWASRNPARLLFQATYAQPLSGRETEENLTLLQGNDIVLRAVEREDLPNYVEWLNDRTVLEYFGQYLPMTLAQEEKWYEAMLPDPDTCTFSIEYEGQHVGGAGFTQIEARQRNAKVGLFIGVPDLWDPGLGSDVMQTILRYGFRHLNLHRIYLRVFFESRRAVHLYEKLGFQHEGGWRQAEFRNGRYHDILWMSERAMSGRANRVRRHTQSDAYSR